jgi:hypothetical protein
MTKHLGIAKKVNDYLSSLPTATSECQQHHIRVQEWLSKLEAQVGCSKL